MKWHSPILNPKYILIIDVVLNTYTDSASSILSIKTSIYLQQSRNIALPVENQTERKANCGTLNTSSAGGIP